MDFFECIESRRSVRAYKPDPVEEDKLEKLLDAAAHAPTACNKQPFRVLVIHTSGREAGLKRVYDKAWFVQAPLVLAVCSLPASAWSRRDGKNYADVDATIAMDHLILAARALGLGSCWIGAFDPTAAREVFHLQPGWEPLALTPIGYPAEEPGPRPRKGLDEIAIRS
jgi:Nitroreductase